MRALHCSAGLLALLTLAGCPPGDDDDAVSDCPVEDRYTSDPEEACTENFCGLPEVQAATGTSGDDFTLLSNGDEIPIFWGPQGGYHMDFAVRMQNLCPVVFVDFELYDVTDGDDVLVHSVRRHVQAVREDSDPAIPSIQRWWQAAVFRIPCQWWPDDQNPDHNVPECNETPLGYLEQRDLKLRVGAEDHNEDRSASTEVLIDAVCCED